MTLRSVCRTCGAENDVAARSCTRCGSSRVTPPIAGGESRKVVTVIFSDITGSTALGEKLDPESIRRIMSRYFEEMKMVLERHGGAVEKFIGDAVMAVFGIPQAHEDDALRGVRAAVEMRTALQRLNEELQPTWGVSIETRTGVNSGEVVVGEPGSGQSLVVGDPVNTAARLEQAADPGTILIGEPTHRMVRDAVVAEQVDPLTLRGKELPVAAWKVLEVVPETPGWSRRLDSPLVGREAELEALDAAFRKAVDSRRCQLVTLMGPAGVGKSRLAQQFLAGAAPSATVIRGRCLSYGEGITFWPVLEAIRDAADIFAETDPNEARGRLSGLLEGAPDADVVRDRVSALLGLGELTPALQETFWGVRRLFEVLASRLPLIVEFDDVHWGEPTFLDLVEYLASSIREAPVLLLCLTRPELLETRPGWTTGRDNEVVVHVEPLPADDIERLMRNLLGGGELAPQARARILEVSEGNPLFVEETLRMLVDDAVLEPVNGHWEARRDITAFQIPPTIHTLLAARLDRLGLEERAVIERASIVGRVFWWETVSALSPEPLREAVGGQLQSLTRKELVRPDFSDLRLGDAYRFSHTLIRDATYAAIPKSTRAELHQRLAAWIEQTFGDRLSEYEEILGFHLEQAHRALTELGLGGEEVVGVGRRASAALGSAGLRAFSRGDMPAAVNLLSRAAALGPTDDSQRLQLLPSLAFALMETGDFPRLQEVVTEAAEAAETSGDAALQGNVALLGLWIRLFTEPEGWAEQAHREASGVLATMEELGDAPGQARASALLGVVHLVKAQFQAAEEAWRRAVDFARRAGDRRNELDGLAWVPLALWAGPAPPEEAIRRSEEVVERAAGDKKVTATALFIRAPFEAGRGRIEEARDLIARARAILEEVELTVWLAGPLAQVSGWVELTAGDAEAAERELRRGLQTLQQIGDVAWLSTTVAILAEALYRQGRDEEAAEFAAMSEEAAAPDDVYSQAMWRNVRAKILARRGELGPAEALAREAVHIAEPSDFLHLRSQTLTGLAEVLASAGRLDEAREALRQAAALFRRKGNEVEAARAEETLPGPD